MVVFISVWCSFCSLKGLENAEAVWCHGSSLAGLALIMVRVSKSKTAHKLHLELCSCLLDTYTSFLA